MIELGCCDDGVGQDACHAYAQRLKAQTGLLPDEVADGLDRLRFRPMPPAAASDMTVAQVQQALKGLGFFPGARVDGICGYRTQSAIRLFQEQVRSVERLPCTPDGRFGPQTQAHLRRWLAGPLRMPWAEAIGAWQAGHPVGLFSAWLGWLAQLQAQKVAQPGPLLARVAAFGGASDTRKPADWDFSPTAGAHLLGIRRHELAGRFDDVFLLLIKGLVFTFQGTTEPGRSDNAGGAPFLVPGQHRYRFGWHQHKYLALKPRGVGVLVQRTGSPERLSPPDAARPLEVNDTINIHWGGRGELRAIGGWSEGCQTINGTLYGDAAGQVQNCSAFTATTPDEARTDPAKTRGAYTLLLDLVTALGSDLPDDGLLYTLVDEADLAGAPEALRQHLAAARAALG